MLIPTVAALGAGAALAVGQIPGSGNTYTGCVLTNNVFTVPLGSLRVLDPSVTGDTECTTGEEQITWNQQGPQGQTGATGATGPAGPAGPAGPTGPAGSVQVSAGPGADIFMYLAPTNDLGKLTGESGDQLTPTKTKAFELSSFTLDASNPVSIGSATTGAGAGKVKFEPFQFVKPVDKYTAELFQDLSSGTRISSIEIVVRRPGDNGLEDPLIQYMLKPVILTNLHISGESKSATETVQAEFGAVQFAVYAQKPNGQSTVTSTGGWNQITNKPDTTIAGLSLPGAAHGARK